MHGIDFTVSKEDAVEDIYARGTYKRRETLLFYGEEFMKNTVYFS